MQTASAVPKTGDLNFVILYVDSPPKSAAFYTELLGCKPVESSETFAMFVLPTGAKLGLWSRHTVAPPAVGGGGGAEIVFTLDDSAAVNALHAAWSERGIPIA